MLTPRGSWLRLGSSKNTRFHCPSGDSASAVPVPARRAARVRTDLQASFMRLPPRVVGPTFPGWSRAAPEHLLPGPPAGQAGSCPAGHPVLGLPQRGREARPRPPLAITLVIALQQPPWVGSIAKCASPTFAGTCPSETPLART